MLCLFFINQTRREVGIDCHLLAGNGVEREACAHFRDTRRTLCNDKEVDDDEDRENDKADDEVATHHELREAVNHMTCCQIAFIAVRENHARRRNIERQTHHGCDQQHGRESREIKRTLNPQRNHEDKDGKGNRESETNIQNDCWHRQEKHGENNDNAGSKTQVATCQNSTLF